VKIIRYVVDSVQTPLFFIGTTETGSEVLISDCQSIRWNLRRCRSCRQNKISVAGGPSSSNKVIGFVQISSKVVVQRDHSVSLNIVLALTLCDAFLECEM